MLCTPDGKLKTEVLEGKVVEFLDSLGLFNDLLGCSFRPQLVEHNGRNILILNIKVGSHKVEDIKELPWENLVIYGAPGKYAGCRELKQYYVLSHSGEWFPEQIQDVKTGDSTATPAASSAPAVTVEPPKSPTPPEVNPTLDTPSSESL